MVDNILRKKNKTKEDLADVLLNISKHIRQFPIGEGRELRFVNRLEKMALEIKDMPIVEQSATGKPKITRKRKPKKEPETTRPKSKVDYNFFKSKKPTPPNYLGFIDSFIGDAGIEIYKNHETLNRVVGDRNKDNKFSDFFLKGSLHKGRLLDLANDHFGLTLDEIDELSPVELLEKIIELRFNELQN